MRARNSSRQTTSPIRNGVSAATAARLARSADFRAKQARVSKRRDHAQDVATANVAPKAACGARGTKLVAEELRLELVVIATVLFRAKQASVAKSRDDAQNVAATNVAPTTACDARGTKLGDREANASRSPGCD
jgi:hypothetical protein